jgi:hypothetical protein
MRKLALRVFPVRVISLRSSSYFMHLGYERLVAGGYRVCVFAVRERTCRGRRLKKQTVVLPARVAGP